MRANCELSKNFFQHTTDVGLHEGCRFLRDKPFVISEHSALEEQSALTTNVV